MQVYVMMHYLFNLPYDIIVGLMINEQWLILLYMYINEYL